MLNSAPIRYTIYGTLLLVLSEVGYYSCRALKNWYNSVRKPKELWALILTNEQSLSCLAEHQGNSRKLSAISLNAREPLDKISIIETKLACANPYCMGSNIDRIVDLLNATKYSIDLAMFVLTSVKISKALVKAYKRGVIIRIIIDNDGAYSTNSQCGYLMNQDIAIRLNSHLNGRLMHHKFCILDSPSSAKYLLKKQNNLTKHTLKEINNISSILMMGSANWTIQAFATNYENILLTNQKQLIKKYSDEFQRLWELFAPTSSERAGKFSLINFFSKNYLYCYWNN
ncbi:mitochondrial cardiolipin hydrolase-like isoform X1 [Glossina fuscipes]|uniref:Mitochondrial cardiolipin hydrolase n=1 Tax=Glossina fuscipes TaxID=7396 RepID=A0A8U0W5W3_9MUSC|nr:mitochondrial cardiolipin hydrolase-like isoform X1 [Glossina fuscipes]